MDTRNHAETLHAPKRKPKPAVPQEQKLSKLPQHTPPVLSPGLAAPPAHLQPNHVLALQRAIGNRAVTRLLPRAAPLIQCKLMVGPVNDVYEQQADRVAEQVMQSSESANERMSEAGPAAPAIHRREVSEEEVQTKPLQRQADGSFEAGSEVERRLAAGRGSGNPLPTETRAFMEPRFGADFSQVRVHTGGEAAQLNRQLSAQAFTTGSDIYFGAGQYSPDTTVGKSLLAHELTHVVQQTGAIQRRGNRIPPATLLEGRAKAGFKVGGKSTYAKLMDAVRDYHEQIPNDDYQGQLNQLTLIAELIGVWEGKHGPAVKVESGRKGKLSKGDKRRNVVFTLKQVVPQEREIVQNQYFQSLPPVTPEMFSDENATNVIPEAVGGQMNKLDEITYGFGVTTQGGESKQVAGGQFTGYFKEQQDVDPTFGMHRGTNTGIPQNDPKFSERNLAMYEIDKLLGANVIPPTFAATHNDKTGIIMEKVNGITGDKATQTQLANPLVRQSLSKLYLLDAICGQVDRHPGNFMVVIEDGVIKGAKGIDNDLSFGQQYTGKIFEDMQGLGAQSPNLLAWSNAGKMPSMLDEIDETFALKIIELANRPELVENALKGLLSEGEIASTIARLTKLAEFLQPLIGQPDGPMKTHWD